MSEKKKVTTAKEKPVKDKTVKIKIGSKSVSSTPTGTMLADNEYTVKDHVAAFFIKRKEAEKV